MASEDKIREFIGLLEIFGLLTKQKGAPALLEHSNARVRQQGEAALVQGYHRFFLDVADIDFAEAVEGFFRSEKAQWYPQPGTLRAFLPTRLLRDLVAESADAAWGELWEGHKRTGCGPGAPRNPFMLELSPPDARTLAIYGVQWDWAGGDGEVAAKRHTLAAMGGLDAILRKRRDDNEAALVKHWRAVFVAYVARHELREELSIVRELAAHAQAGRAGEAALASPPSLALIPESPTDADDTDGLREPAGRVHVLRHG